MLRRISFFLALSLTGPLLAAPDPSVLLEKASLAPSFGYHGRMMLTHWNGTTTQAEEANVFFQPPDRYRYEYLSMNGQVDRIVVGDGAREQIRFPDKNQVLEGASAHNTSGRLSREQERQMILANYKLSISGSETVMGRKAWILDMAPTETGKPSQRLWIDQQNHMVLEIRRTNETTGTGSLARFVRIEAPAKPGTDLFLPALETQSVETPVQSQATVPQAGVPGKLIAGFSLQGEDLFDVNGHLVRHLRYTDGLLPLSLFVTDSPVESGSTDVYQASLVPGATPTLAPGGIQTSHWKEGKSYYTLMGEISSDLLARIHRESLRPALAAR